MHGLRDIQVNNSESEVRKLRRQLETEIIWLERQMDELTGTESELDLSLRQTYKEIIFPRRALLRRMPR